MFLPTGQVKTGANCLAGSRQGKTKKSVYMAVDDPNDNEDDKNTGNGNAGSIDAPLLTAAPKEQLSGDSNGEANEQ